MKRYFPFGGGAAISLVNKFAQALLDVDDASLRSKFRLKRKSCTDGKRYFNSNRKERESEVSPGVIRLPRKISTGMVLSICHSNQWNPKIWLMKSATSF